MSKIKKKPIVAKAKASKSTEKSQAHGILRRIEIFAEYQQISIATLEQLCDIPLGTLAGIKFRQKNNPNIDAEACVGKILTAFKIINARWLIINEGTMLEPNALTKITSADYAFFTALLGSFKERTRRFSTFLEEINEETTNVINSITPPQ